ncbi:MAG: hypothetical protein F4Y47_02040 [Acidobacteriia bacterium]|nr:hypothetical protein [Terriglobia bacterium]MYG04772.1 hypothetical protein [Terriglobia bacterium]MYK08397.1 hypothetical protein [Terriglobia bacterium]
MSDDRAANPLGARGGRLAPLDPTTEVDKLAGSGMLFENASCTNRYAALANSMHVLAAAAILLGLSASAHTKPEFFAESVAFGGKDYLFCHTEPGAGRTWNDRGHWLVTRKQESGQETIAGSSLSDYVSPEASEISRSAASEAQPNRRGS